MVMKAVQAASAGTPCSAFVGTVMNAGAAGARGVASRVAQQGRVPACTLQEPLPDVPGRTGEKKAGSNQQRDAHMLRRLQTAKQLM